MLISNVRSSFRNAPKLQSLTNDWLLTDEFDTIIKKLIIAGIQSFEFTIKVFVLPPRFVIGLFS